MAVTVKATLGAGHPMKTTDLSNPEGMTLQPELPYEAVEVPEETSPISATTPIQSPVIPEPVSQPAAPRRAALLDVTPKLTVIGVGGAGGNAVNNMIKYKLQGVTFVAANTDAQALQNSQAPYTVQLGQTTTQGLGAGSRPVVGRSAAEESIQEILEIIGDSNMVFITAGMGGGTGTGAAPVIAQAAREKGILTVGVVTKPFQFEGAHRMRTAEQGIEEMQRFVDTLIIIPNQNLFRIANERTTFAEAFKMADDVLYSGVRSITDLMIIPGLINLDFADIKTVMTEMGKAMMGTGEASGENRAIMAAEAAIANPLLDDVSMRGAKGVLISVTGGMDMTLFDVDAAANRIRDEVELDSANIIFGSTFDPSMEGMVRVSVVATGIDQGNYARFENSIPRASIQNPSTYSQSTNEETLDFVDFSHEEEDFLEGPEVTDQLETLESSHTFNNTTEEEDEFLLSEESPREAPGLDHTRHEPRHRPQKASFFSRLFGGKTETTREPSGMIVRSTDAEDAEIEEDISNIPAYLRRQK